MPQKNLDDFTIEELFNETIARDDRTKGIAPSVAINEDLKGFSDKEVAEKLVARQKVIYGPDNRVEAYQAPPAVKTITRSVCAIFRANSVIDNGDGTSTLNTQQYGPARGLCQEERFFDQPIGAICTGFLIGPRRIATAGHCADPSAGSSTDYRNLRFVFGFQMQDDGTIPTIIPNSDIYSAVRILGRVLDSSGDWAVLELDRDIVGRNPLQTRTSGKVPDNEDVYVIGHPVGLPAKYSAGAQVRDNSPASYYVANLDTYGGNSGSPVFNQNDNKVEGILVRGEEDFIWNGNCYISKACPDPGCRGEDCTRATEFKNHIETPESESNGCPYCAIGLILIFPTAMWIIDFLLILAGG